MGSPYLSTAGSNKLHQKLYHQSFYFLRTYCNHEKNRRWLEFHSGILWIFPGYFHKNSSIGSLADFYFTFSPRRFSLLIWGWAVDPTEEHFGTVTRIMLHSINYWGLFVCCKFGLTACSPRKSIQFIDVVLQKKKNFPAFSESENDAGKFLLW